MRQGPSGPRPLVKTKIPNNHHPSLHLRGVTIIIYFSVAQAYSILHMGFDPSDFCAVVSHIQGVKDGGKLLSHHSDWAQHPVVFPVFDMI